MACRIGVVGWGVRTGLGYMHYDMWRLGFVDEWLVVQHPRAGVMDSMVPPESTRCDLETPHSVYEAFLDRIDVLVICERPVLGEFPLLQLAKRHKVLTCCIPMMEWLPPIGQAEWLRFVDVMWAPTQWSMRELKQRADRSRRSGYKPTWHDHVVGGRWGVNIERFPFTQRTRCDQYLFCNGAGGAQQRKGLHILAEAARAVRDIPILVRSQKSEIPALPKNCEVIVDNSEDSLDLYSRGDVLLAPSRFEGLGLPLYEAQACGIPVITTDGPPMNECTPLAVIAAGRSTVNLHTWTVNTYEPSPQALARLLTRYHGIDLTEVSRLCHQHMAENFNLKDTLIQLRAYLERTLGDSATRPVVSEKLPRTRSLRSRTKYDRRRADGTGR